MGVAGGAQQQISQKKRLCLVCCVCCVVCVFALHFYLLFSSLFCYVDTKIQVCCLFSKKRRFMMYIAVFFRPLGSLPYVFVLVVESETPTTLSHALEKV